MELNLKLTVAVFSFEDHSENLCNEKAERHFEHRNGPMKKTRIKHANFRSTDDLDRLKKKKGYTKTLAPYICK